MIIKQSKIERLLHHACNARRTSPTLSDDAIVHESRRQIRKPTGAASRNVVAASLLVSNQANECLRILAEHESGLESDAMASRIAGYAYLVQGDEQVAQAHFSRSVKLDPCHADCWTWLGKIAERHSDKELATGYYERGIVFDDDDYEATLALSQMLVRSRKLKDAIHTLRVGLMRDARSPKLNLALARLLKRQGLLLKRQRKLWAQQKVLSESLACYKVVNAAKPTARTLIAQGLLLQQLNHMDAARKCFQSAVDRDAKSMFALGLLANANVDCGNIDEAIIQFQQVIAANPNSSINHFRYSRAKKFRRGLQSSRYIKTLKAQLSRDDLSTRDQVNLNFAMAKVLENLKRYDRAWTHYQRANRLKTSQSKTPPLPSNSSDKPSFFLERIADESIRCFTGQFFAQHRQFGSDSATPIFIIGMPRSGTTLTEQILSSHPQVAGAGELTIINQLRHGLVHRDSYPQGLTNLPASQFEEVAGRYLRHLDQYRTAQQTRVTDKMPTNFMHLGMISTMFPKATIIHCRRNPLDVFVSSFCQNLSETFSDLDQLVQYYAQYRRIVTHFEQVLPGRIHTVDYEAMVSDPQRHCRDLIQHCGLQWDDRCLEFHKNNRSVHTPSKVQVRQPMYKTSVEKWRRFEKHLRPIAAKVAAL